MIDALFTVAVYAAIAIGLLYGAILVAAVGIAVWDRVAGEHLGYDDLNEYQPVDETDWRSWDWPVPEDDDGWNFPERDAV